MKKQLKKSILKPKHFDILSEEQKQIFSKLNFTKEYGFYLAGGTALAFYLNHRTPQDFDFYSQKTFEKLKLSKLFEKYYKNFEIEIIRDTSNSFEVRVKNTHLSFFHYPYELIRKLNSFREVYIASLEDITAMKIIFIVQRGNFRDFIDIYFLIKNFGLESIIEWTKEKYYFYSVILILKGLTCFKDAEKTIKENKSRIKVFDDTKWKGVKNFILKEVRKFIANFPEWKE